MEENQFVLEKTQYHRQLHAKGLLAHSGPMKQGSMVQDRNNGRLPHNCPQRGPNIPVEEHQDRGV